MSRVRGRAEAQSEAEALAASALAFLAEDPSRLGRFLADTGLSPAELGAAAGQTTTLEAVLDHLLGDESLLLVFAAGAGVEAARVGQARAVLGGMAPPEPARKPSRRWPGPGG